MLDPTLCRPARRPLLAVLACATALTAAPALAQDTAGIGILAPLTGGAAADGEEMVRGATLAVEELNAAGGVAGYQFEIVVGDTRDQNADAVISAFERLTSDDTVNFIATGYASGSNFEIEYMAEIDMPYVVGANSAQTLAIIGPSPDDFPTVWSMTPSFDAYETELVPVVEQLAEAGMIPAGDRTVALISSDNPYSRTIYEGLMRSFEGAGWTVTLDELLPFGEISDWRALLARVRENPPDVLINTDYLPANAATFMTQFMEDPTDSLVFIQYAPSVPEFVELTADQSTGVTYNLLGGVLNTPGVPRAAEIQQAFQARWGVESGTYGVMLYETVMMYADVLEAVGDPTDRLAIGAALGQVDRETALGRVAFDPETHLARQGNDFVPIQFYQIWDGERVLFYPPQYATGDFRRPPWMAE